MFDKYFDKEREDELFDGSKPGGLNYSFWHSRVMYRFIVVGIPFVFGCLFLWFAWLSFPKGMFIVNIFISAYFFYEMIKKFKETIFYCPTLYEIYFKNKKR